MGEKQTPLNPPDRATTISLNPPDRPTTISRPDRQIHVLLISIPNPSCVQESVVGEKWTLFITFVFRRWSGKQLRPDIDPLRCSSGVVDGMPRAGSHYYLGTSRGPDKIRSRAGPGPRAVSCTWLLYMMLHTTHVNDTCRPIVRRTFSRLLLVKDGDMRCFPLLWESSTIATIAAEFWKSFVSGVTNSFRSLCRTCGCILSWPEDLSIFNFVSFPLLQALLSQAQVECFPHVFPLCLTCFPSTVITLVKSKTGSAPQPSPCLM